jgi:hypothetical protein
MIFVLLLFAASTASAQQVTASIDRNRIVQGETVTLVLETGDPKQSLEADLAPLEPDFAVLDRRSETQMSIVNGRQSAEVRMVMVLEPRRSGDLVIPSLSIGNTKTQALPIRVDPAPEPEPGEMPPVFIEVEVVPEDMPAYVHAQLGLTVRVFYQQNLTEAAISQPEPSPASVRLLDEVPFQADRNGTRYRVLERHYAVFPERSGELVIPALQLSGRLVERRTDRLWQPAVRGRRIQVESEPIRIDVQPRPVSFTGDTWQPARKLDLMQQISAASSLTVGEPVTRTVIVDAVGLEENMIAEPVWPKIPDVRIYPDQPTGISRDDGQWVLGHKEFRYAVVPEQEGVLVLPELKVHWWDTVNNRQQTSVLPAHRLEVLASAATPVSPQLPSAPGSSVASAGDYSLGQSGQEPGYWRVLALLFAVLWVLTLAVAWRWRGMQNSNSDYRELERDADESALLRQLKQYCDGADRAGVRQAMGDWLRRFGPPGASASVLEFAALVDDETLRQCLHALDSTGFRPKQEEGWDSKALWKHFESWRKAWRQAAASEKAPLTDLYARGNRKPLTH